MIKRTLEIRKKTWLNKDTFAFELFLPGIKPLPGQFFQIQINENMEPFLNRPISIASYEKGRLGLIIKVVGRGTEILSTKKPGEYLTLFGPFGHGVKLKSGKSLLLAGGIGVAPLYFLAQNLSQRGIPFTFLYGAKDPTQIILRSQIEKLANQSIFVTECGSRRKGTVVSAIKKIALSEYKNAYACGPQAMLRALQRLKLQIKINAFCEDFLGCGCGLCLGCAIMYQGVYKRICEDGPVFELGEIKFET